MIYNEYYGEKEKAAKGEKLKKTKPKKDYNAKDGRAEETSSTEKNIKEALCKWLLSFVYTP
jgi:hypothetical protein